MSLYVFTQRKKKSITTWGVFQRYLSSKQRGIKTNGLPEVPQLWLGQRLTYKGGDLLKYSCVSTIFD